MVVLTREFQMRTGNTVTLSNKDGTRTSSLFSSLFFIQLLGTLKCVKSKKKQCSNLSQSYQFHQENSRSDHRDAVVPVPISFSLPIQKPNQSQLT